MDLDTENVVNAAVAGLSNKAIAKRFGCSLDAVQNALDKHAVELLKPEGRAAILALQIERMKQLQSHFLRYAIENDDSTAGTLCVKIGQRIAALTGVDQPASIRLDINQVQPQDNKTNTQRMLEAVRALRNENPPDPDYEPDPEEEREKFNEMPND